MTNSEMEKIAKRFENAAYPKTESEIAEFEEECDIAFYMDMGYGARCARGIVENKKLGWFVKMFNL